MKLRTKTIDLDHYDEQNQITEEQRKELNEAIDLYQQHVMGLDHESSLRRIQTNILRKVQEYEIMRG